MTTFKAQTQINAMTMGKKDNPVIVIKELERILHKYASVPFARVNETMLVAHLIKIAPESYSQTIAKNAPEAQQQGHQTTLSSLKTDMSSVYVVMSKGKWMKQAPLEIQHGLTTKEGTVTNKTMEKAMRDTVDEAMENGRHKAWEENQGAKEQLQWED